MIDLKQLFDAYNICARFAPGFLFVYILFFLQGEQDMFFQQNSVLFITLIVTSASIAGFLSALLMKEIEQLIWKFFENPMIKYFKKEDLKLYEQICQKYGDKEVVTHVKAETRGDKKLLWKNIAYGFFRNSIFLALLTLPFSYTSKYYCINIQVVIIVTIATIVCSRYYARQAFESYKEKNLARST